MKPIRLAILIFFVSLFSNQAVSQRKITPVNPESGIITISREQREKQYNDSIKAAKDSINARKQPAVKYPLFHNLTVGANLWEPTMRLLGQDYGLIDFSIELSLRNRFYPIVELGLGEANHWGDDRNYHYTSNVSPYFKLGLNYNFLYKKIFDYQLFAGLRYGFSPFKFEVTDITAGSPYWSESVITTIPSQNVSAGWLEILFGIKVKLVKDLSMGWSVRYGKILHGGKTDVGEPYYIPGLGDRNTALKGSFSIYYTLPVFKKNTTTASPDKSELQIDVEHAE